jgi:hypothetical protein
MQYLATSFSLVLGAWRLKFAVAVEDALEDEPRQRMATAAPATHHLRVLEDSMLGRSARGPRR